MLQRFGIGGSRFRGIIAKVGALPLTHGLVETAGIGQGDAAVAPLADLAVYVMTSEFGAPTQLEKIDMLDYADLVVINKFDRRASEDALRDVRKQYQRNHELFAENADAMPVFGTIASRFADPGVTALYQKLLGLFEERGLGRWKSSIEPLGIRCSEPGTAIVPPQRQWYLGEIIRLVPSVRGTALLQND